jgi:hypothetical protein
MDYAQQSQAASSTVVHSPTARKILAVVKGCHSLLLRCNVFNNIAYLDTGIRVFLVKLEKGEGSGDILLQLYRRLLAITKSGSRQQKLVGDDRP